MLLAGLANVPFAIFTCAQNRSHSSFEGDKGSHLFPLFIVPTAHCQPLQETVVMVWLNKAAASVLRKKQHGPDLEVHRELYNDIKSPQ